MTKPTTDIDLSGPRTQHTKSDLFCFELAYEMLCFVDSGLALNGYSTLDPRLNKLQGF